MVAAESRALIDVSPRRAQKKSPACPTGNRQRMITGRPSWSRPATFCTSVAEYWLTQIAQSFRPVSLRCIPAFQLVAWLAVYGRPGAHLGSRGPQADVPDRHRGDRDVQLHLFRAVEHRHSRGDLLRDHPVVHPARHGVWAAGGGTDRRVLPAAAAVQRLVARLSSGI